MSAHTETALAPSQSRGRTWSSVRVAAIPLTLGIMVVLSTAVRAAASFPRATPRLLPDEFLYIGIARSVAHAHAFEVLGQSASFPQFLEPLLIAPFWASDDTTRALQLTQLYHGLAMSLAVVPVYLIARTLSLSKGLALSCAAVAVVTPGLMYTSYVTADAVGYLLALTAVLMAVRALQAPSIRSQSAFLIVAGLASSARMQYILLFPVFVIAALVVERGHPLRTARRYPVISGLMLVLCPLAFLVAGRSLLGRYETITTFGVSGETLVSALSTGMVLAIAVGAAVVPGAVAWTTTTILNPRSREQAAFAAFSLALVLGLVVASALMSVETGSDRFFERYLVASAPLAAIAMCCWVTSGRPGRLIAIGTAAAVVVAVARIPLAEQLVGQGSADSPTLLAVSRLGSEIGLANASLVAAIGVTAGAIVAIAAALSHRVPVAALLGVTIAVFVALSIGAHAADLKASRNAVRTTWSGGDPLWLEKAHPGPVVLVQTPGSSPYISQFAIVWGPSIHRAVRLLGEGYTTEIDGADPSPATVRADGTLLADGDPVAGSALFATAGATPIFGGRDTVVRERFFTLVKPADRVRLTAYAEGVRADTTLAPVGEIAAYPTRAGQCTRATVRLMLPPGIPPTTLQFTNESGIRKTVVVRAGAVSRVNIVSKSTGGRSLRYKTLRLGAVKPDAGVTNVANADFTARSVPCQMGSQA